MKNAIYDFTEDILIVSLCGEIDHHNAASLRREIDESMTAFHAKNLILDYSDVSFMDSSGIGLAMGRYNKVKELSGSRKPLCKPCSGTFRPFRHHTEDLVEEQRAGIHLRERRKEE